MSTWKRRPNESSAKRSMVIPKKPPSVTPGNNAGSPPRLRGKGCGVRTWASHARRRLTAYGTGKFLLGELSGEVPSRRWPESTSTIRPYRQVAALLWNKPPEKGIFAIRSGRDCCDVRRPDCLLHSPGPRQACQLAQHRPSVAPAIRDRQEYVLLSVLGG